MLLLILLFVHRSAHAKITALTTQFDLIKQSVSSNQVTPEDIEQTFDRKLRELETRRMEAMKQMREAHQKQQQAQAPIKLEPAVSEPPEAKTTAPLVPSSQPVVHNTTPQIIELPPPRALTSRDEPIVEILEDDAPVIETHDELQKSNAAASEASEPKIESSNPHASKPETAKDAPVVKGRAARKIR